MLVPRSSVILTFTLFFLLLVAAFSQTAPVATGDQLFSQNDFQGAKLAFQDAERRAPHQVTTRLGLIRTLLRLDQWADALIEAQSAVQTFPQNADVHGLSALAQMRAGQVDTATKEAAASLALDPINYWGIVASGRIAAWNGDNAGAYRLFRQAATLSPTESDAWQQMLDIPWTAGENEWNAAVASYLKLAPKGYPHDKTVAKLNEERSQGQAYWSHFEGTIPFGETSTGQNTAGHDSSAASEATYTVPLERDDNYLMIPLQIDGQKFRVLFDTGGARTLLMGRKASGRLHLQSIVAGTVNGVGGTEASQRLKASALTMGNLTLHDVPLEVVQDHDRFGKEVGQIGDGLLGGDVLRRYVLIIDQDANTLTLKRGAQAGAPPTQAGHRSLILPIHVFAQHIFLQVRIEDRPVWAIVDTGAYQSILSARLAREIAAKRPKTLSDSGSARTGGGLGTSLRHMDYVTLRNGVILAIGDRAHMEDPSRFLTMDIPNIDGLSLLDDQVSPDMGVETGLLLGALELAQFSRVTIDYPHHLLTLEYTDH